MKILLFGRLADPLGREIEFELPAGVHTVAQLRETLAARHPEIARELARPAVRACIGDSLVPDEASLDGAPEIAFLPPLSGG